MPDKEFVVEYIVHRDEETAAQKASIAGYRSIGKQADQTAKAAGAAATGEAATRKKATAEALAASVAAGAARIELIRRERIITAKTLADQGEAAKRAAARMAVASGVAAKFSGVLGGIGSAAFGFSGIAGMIDGITESFARAKAESIAAGKAASDYRATLKEVAFLKGSTSGPSAEVIRGDLKYRTQTLQDAGNARQVQEAFMNASGTSVDTDQTKRKMTQEAAQAAMVHAGRMQSQFGGSGEAYGNLAGTIPLMERTERLTGDDVIRRMSQLNEIGQRGKASPDRFAAQIAESSYLASSGAYRDAARLAAVGSTLSLATPNEISTGLTQVHKATTGALTNQEMPKGSQMSPAQYMKGLGANDQMDDLDILGLMFGDMAKAEGVRNAKGENFSIDTYLSEKGYGDEKERARISTLYGFRNDLNKTMLPLAERMPTLAEATNPFQKFQASVQGQKQASDVAMERTQITTGMGAQEYYARLEQQAYATMKQEGSATDSLEGMRGGYLGSRKIQGRMIEMLREEGKADGLDYGVKYRDNGRGSTVSEDPLANLFSGLTGSPGNKSSADAFYERAQQIRGAGGSIMGDNSQVAKQFLVNSQAAIDSNVRVEALLTDISRKLEPARVQTVAPGGANGGRAR